MGCGPSAGTWREWECGRRCPRVGTTCGAPHQEPSGGCPALSTGLCLRGAPDPRGRWVPVGPPPCVTASGPDRSLRCPSPTEVCDRAPRSHFPGEQWVAVCAPGGSARAECPQGTRRVLSGKHVVSPQFSERPLPVWAGGPGWPRGSQDGHLRPGSPVPTRSAKPVQVWTDGSRGHPCPLLQAAPCGCTGSRPSRLPQARPGTGTRRLPWECLPSEGPTAEAG